METNVFNPAIKAIEYSIIDTPVALVSEASGNSYLQFNIKPKLDILAASRYYNIFFNGDEAKQTAQLEAIMAAYTSKALKSIWLVDVDVPIWAIKDQVEYAENYIRLFETAVGVYNAGDVIGTRTRDGQDVPRVFSSVPVTLRCVNETSTAKGEDPVKAASRWYRRAVNAGNAIPVSEWEGGSLANNGAGAQDALFDGASSEEDDNIDGQGGDVNNGTQPPVNQAVNQPQQGQGNRPMNQNANRFGQR